MTATAVATNPEQELRSQISVLDRRIEAKRKHIEKLTTELREQKDERAGLVRQRIDLLKKELPDEPAASNDK